MTQPDITALIADLRSKRERAYEPASRYEGYFPQIQEEARDARLAATKAWNTAAVNAVDPLIAEIERQAAEIGRLRAAVRVNMLRNVPGCTHADIDAVLYGNQEGGK